MHRDLFNNAKTVVAVDFTILSADAATVGNIIDTDGFESGIVSIQATDVTTGEIIITSIEESDDSGMSGSTVIPAARIIGTAVAVTAADVINEIGFISTKKFIRVTVTGSDTSVLEFSSNCVLGNPSSASVR